METIAMQQSKNMSTLDSSPGGYPPTFQAPSLDFVEIAKPGAKTVKNPKTIIDNSFSSHIEKSIKSSGSVFVKENTGNIKDFYKISSCIGRGKYSNNTNSQQT
jgi:hypothetical protein